MEELKEIILKLLLEIQRKESNVTLSGGYGYSVGKAYPNNGVGVLKLLGKEEDIEESEEDLGGPVKISKVFKKGDRKWYQKEIQK